ncbi:uncharacterized protein LOC119388742 [Rhipicephalus sanguineus]|uniref:uncharacterized protein LOC119388742 n=1 Tax=Rhipicephalus sanguineus TaxID=34632 RepID=UPI0018953C5E|nr:uncharacterized protein LOC119388742 [Rhipicephalus sanguineus]
MIVFDFLSVLVILSLVDKAVSDEQPCGNIARRHAPPGFWPGCRFYCPGINGWEIGFFLDGEECVYNKNADINGTCWQGHCYPELPEGVTLPSTTAVTRKVRTTQLTPESTTTNNVINEGNSTNEIDGKKKKKKKKKKQRKKVKKKDEQEKKEKKPKEKKKKKSKRKEVQSIEW